MATVATAVMVRLAAPVAEGDSAEDPVVPVERVVAPVVDPVLLRALRARAVDRNVATALLVLPDLAAMAAIPVDAMVALAFARLHPRRCLKYCSPSRQKS